MSKVISPLPQVTKMCFGETVARTLHGLRINGEQGVPVDRIRDVAKQNGHDPNRLLNRVIGRRPYRARVEYRDNRRWLVLNKGR